MLPAHAALVKTCNGAHTPTSLNFMRSVVTLCSGQKHIWHLTYTSRSRSAQRTEDRDREVSFEMAVAIHHYLSVVL
jgi:hypothetical protein